jgi:hypothetical protein
MLVGRPNYTFPMSMVHLLERSRQDDGHAVTDRPCRLHARVRQLGHSLFVGRSTACIQATPAVMLSPMIVSRCTTLSGLPSPLNAGGDCKYEREADEHTCG